MKFSSILLCNTYCTVCLLSYVKLFSVCTILQSSLPKLPVCQPACLGLASLGSRFLLHFLKLFLIKTVVLVPCLLTPVFAFLTVSPIGRKNFDESTHQIVPLRAHRRRAELFAAATIKLESAEERCAPLSHTVAASAASHTSQESQVACPIGRSYSLHVLQKSAAVTSHPLWEPTDTPCTLLAKIRASTTDLVSLQRIFSLMDQCLGTDTVREQFQVNPCQVACAPLHRAGCCFGVFKFGRR